MCKYWSLGLAGESRNKVLRSGSAVLMACVAVLWKFSVLPRARREQEPVIVRTYDTPQAVLIPYEEFEAYQAGQDRRQEHEGWLAELRAIAEQVSARAAISDDEAAEWCLRTSTLAAASRASGLSWTGTSPVSLRRLPYWARAPR